LTEPDTLRADIEARALAAGLAISPVVLDGCLRYLTLLARWNSRMNLTALPLDAPVPSRTIDKLLIEPLCAVDWFPTGAETWLDLGSGGGSPALPLRLACRSGSLSMVESRSRKCAFLREAVRLLDLAETHVLMQRFEELELDTLCDVVTLRAVKLDADLRDLISQSLAPGGRVLVFGGAMDEPGMTELRRKTLPDGSFLAEWVMG
jgi:16S rRNA (guanine527-N7)-methyltransferase